MREGKGSGRFAKRVSGEARCCLVAFSIRLSVSFACACLGARERSERVALRRQPQRQLKAAACIKTGTRIMVTCEFLT